MSTFGQVVGTIAGVVIGFYTGGAGWALVGSVMMGAAAGYAAGSALDPTMPDVPAPGQSNTGNLDITLANEGVVVADSLGTCKAAGNIFWYGNNRIVEIKEKVKGGKGGGSKKQKVGEEYYLSWAEGICLGPVDCLISVFSGDDPIWQGNLLRSQSQNGKSTIVTESGSIDFYFGTNDHLPSSAMGTIILTESELSFNPPYKNLCWAYFDDYLLGNYNRAPTIKFVYQKFPEFVFDINNRIGNFDYNPAHAIYYLILKATEIPEEMLDSVSFQLVAEKLTLEARGINVHMGEERQTITYLESILTHIGGILQYENDGKFHLSLMRDNIDPVDMPSFGEEDFTEPPTIKRNSWDETFNDVRVQYAKRVDRKFEEDVNADGVPDVYVIGFIDESTYWDADYQNAVDNCSDPENSGASYTWDNGVHCDEGNAAKGTELECFTCDLEKYFSSDGMGGYKVKKKDWLIPGAGHYTALCHVVMASIGRSAVCPIVPGGYDPSDFTNLYYNSITDVNWAAASSAWSSLWTTLIAENSKGYVHGSVLRVYLDTSSMGGIDALQPAYGQFKSWVQANYGGLVYMEYEQSNERWIRNLHEDLTSYGYGG